MLKNFVIIFIYMAFMLACDTGGQGNSADSAASPFENGKILLADANKQKTRGDDLAANKLYKEAVIEFEKAARQDANQKDLARLLGQSQYRARDFDNAIQWLNKAVKQDDKDVESLQYLGYCYINKTKIPEAEAGFKKAMALDPSGKAKSEIIGELTDIGELSLTLGQNFTSQGKAAYGNEFMKLGMRILAMALDYSDYDMTLAKDIQVHANEIQNQILIDWINNIIDKGGKNILEVGI